MFEAEYASFCRKRKPKPISQKSSGQELGAKSLYLMCFLESKKWPEMLPALVMEHREKAGRHE